MKNATWAISAAVGVAGALAAIGLSRLPIERIGLVPSAPPAVTPPTAPATPPPVVRAPVAAPTPEPEPPRPAPSPDENLYQNEIELQRELSDINVKAGRELQQAGGLSKAEASFRKAVRSTRIATCLEEQQRLRVAFYQGKAICLAATPET